MKTPATTSPGSKAVTAARIMGGQAAQAAAGIGACPFAVDRGGVELVLAMNWVRGYRAVQPRSEDGPAAAEPNGPRREVKFNPAQPRDFRGRWINLGSRVEVNLISGGGEGTVSAVHPRGRFDVTLDNGDVINKVSGEYLSVLDDPVPQKKPPRAPSFETPSLFDLADHPQKPKEPQAPKAPEVSTPTPALRTPDKVPDVPPPPAPALKVPEPPAAPDTPQRPFPTRQPGVPEPEFQRQLRQWNREKMGLDDRWDVGGSGRALGKITTDKLRRGDVVYTGRANTNTQEVELPSTRRAYSGLLKSQQNLRVVDRIERDDDGKARLHFTDGTHTSDALSPRDPLFTSPNQQARQDAYDANPPTDQAPTPEAPDAPNTPDAVPAEQVPEVPTVRALAKWAAEWAGEPDAEADLRLALAPNNGSTSFTAHHRLMRSDNPKLRNAVLALDPASAHRINGRRAYDPGRAREAAQRLTDGDTTLPPLSVGQRAILTVPDPSDTTIRIRGGRPEPQRTMDVEVTVDQVTDQFGRVHVIGTDDNGKRHLMVLPGDGVVPRAGATPSPDTEPAPDAPGPVLDQTVALRRRIDERLQELRQEAEDENYDAEELADNIANDPVLARWRSEIREIEARSAIPHKPEPAAPDTDTPGPVTPEPVTPERAMPERIVVPPEPETPRTRDLPEAERRRVADLRQKIADRLEEISIDAEVDKISPRLHAANIANDRDINRWKAMIQIIEGPPTTATRNQTQTPTTPGPPLETDAAAAAQWKAAVAEQLKERLGMVDRQARAAVARSISGRQTGSSWSKLQAKEAKEGGQPLYAGPLQRVLENARTMEAHTAANQAFRSAELDPARRLAAEAAVTAALRDTAQQAAARIAEDLSALTNKPDTARWRREKIWGARADEIDHSKQAEALAAKLYDIANSDTPPPLHPGVDKLPRVPVRAEPALTEVERTNAAIDFDARNTNPGYGKPGYNINCVHVVNAHELRRRGYDTTATPLPKPYWPQKGRSAQDALNRWRNPDGSRHGRDITKGTSLESITQQAQGWPDGARGWVRVMWGGGGGGHIFNVEKTDGKVRFVEAQTHQPEADMARYARDARTREAWAIARVDDLIPTDYVAEFIHEM